ncbi:MAG: hypothetical protein H6813_05235 [Phycisphaeraceae bacterium]|nr:hypothetical protein [Phycisphaeraceae bacterium]MCB9847787.1 hypothetical protein [Phycisphaeraceae bacterium]
MATTNRASRADHPKPRSRRALLSMLALVPIAAIGVVASGDSDDSATDRGPGSLVMFAYNDLGMHCMNDDYEDLLILPPFNTMRAFVLQRGGSPEPITENLNIRFEVPSNTVAADRTNFWQQSAGLFGVQLTPDVGLFGAGLSGQMEQVPGTKYWEILGVPVTPFEDTGLMNPYALGNITATGAAGNVATASVTPVSVELTCHLCHRTEGISVGRDILQKHDKLHGTNIEATAPVLCAECHSDNALGAPGQPGISSFSHAMHNSHADRIATLNLDNECYACHPGIRTQCQRGNHFVAGVTCNECHGEMTDLGNPARNPWVDLPRCSECHNEPGFEFEEPGKLYKDSRGHGGVYCFVCHGSPHAWAQAATVADNVQATRLQGHPGIISECTTCHTQMPSDPFPHRRED